MKLNRSDIAALFLSLAALVATYLITIRIFDGIPHLEDEMAFVWQAETAARGDLTLDSPACPRCFLVPFVVDSNGLRFGKYPPGWPALLSFGVRFGLREWINPILAALCVWLTYRLGKKLLTPAAGLIAALLTLTSPFFLINSSSLLSHTWSLFLTLAFILAWIDLRNPPQLIPVWLLVGTAGLSLGLLALTRPWTALAVGLPFFIEGLIWLIRGAKSVRQRILLVGVISVITAGLLFLWQYALTGDPFTNPYTLWWSYDRIGFGPGTGTLAEGHNFSTALQILRINLQVGSSDLFGWGRLSWLFLPFGLIAFRRSPRSWPILAIAPSLMLLYLFYWASSWIFGPRYYFEGLASLSIASSAGILWLAGKLSTGLKEIKKNESCLRVVMISVLVTALLTVNAIYYLPSRIGGLRRLYGASSAQFSRFENSSAAKLTPALVIVHWTKDWREYGTLLELSSPYFDTPFVFTVDRGQDLNILAIQSLPGRSVYYYYPDQPTTLFTAPLPASE